MPEAILTLKFDDQTRALGFQFDAEMPDTILEKLFHALMTSARDTIGIKYQEQPKYRFYRGIEV